MSNHPCPDRADGECDCERGQEHLDCPWYPKKENTMHFMWLLLPMPAHNKGYVWALLRDDKEVMRSHNIYDGAAEANANMKVAREALGRAGSFDPTDE